MRAIINIDCVVRAIWSGKNFTVSGQIYLSELRGLEIRCWSADAENLLDFERGCSQFEIQRSESGWSVRKEGRHRCAPHTQEESDVLRKWPLFTSQCIQKKATCKDNLNFWFAFEIDQLGSKASRKWIIYTSLIKILNGDRLDCSNYSVSTVSGGKSSSISTVPVSEQLNPVDLVENQPFSKSRFWSRSFCVQHEADHWRPWVDTELRYRSPQNAKMASDEEGECLAAKL